MARSTYHHGDLREGLLAAAEQELIEKGIEGFSLRGVAKRAGVSHAAPAHHFRDTAELLTALAAVAARRFHQAIKTSKAAAAKDARSRFLASGRAYVGFACQNPAMFELMFGSRRPDFTSDDFVRPATDAFRELVGDVAALRGDDPLASPEGRADVLAAWSLVHGLSTLLIAGRVGFIRQDADTDFDAMLQRVLERLLPGHQAEQAPLTTSD